jgi:long-chain acyl-CoA synthetase
LSLNNYPIAARKIIFSLHVADEYRGEVIHAFAALAPGTSASEEDVIEYCAQNLAKY